VLPITAYDTCDTLYERVADSNEQMILRAIPKIAQGERPGRPQVETEEPPLPGRKPEHGQIDWERSNVEVYNFIRALTRPYPGAFSMLDGERWFIWQAALIPMDHNSSVPAGTTLGPIYSPVGRACGQLVACGKGAIALLDIEGQGGRVLTGRSLSDRPWTGKVWGNE
jgi:methionyl-tRNA formyltransferase